MILLFHQTTSSVDRLLGEGLKSANILAQEGKVEKKPNNYEIAVLSYENWVEERKVTLRDNPNLLKQILNMNSLKKYLENNGSARFDAPSHSGNRFNNVYFQFFNTPPANSDWVAIDVPDSTLLHDATCRDRSDPELWRQSACSIKHFQESISNGEMPYRWHGIYNEHLIRDSVPSERIIAYAKLEKELPLESTKATLDQLKQVQVYLSDKLSFATQFENPADNILISEKDGKYQIRISFNKDKVTGRESDVSSIFHPIQSMNELIEKSQEREKIVNGGLVAKLSTKLEPEKSDIKEERGGGEDNSPHNSPRHPSCLSFLCRRRT